ncbi:MAG: flagellar motor switch protein FliN [Candidatus Eremiobacteraeota bacterium]|nr:flagellar motor switch protein FliN [Candidatus Eremiobacteraeota bacterium]
MSIFLNENQQIILMDLFENWMRANEEILGSILNRKLVISPSNLSDKPIGRESALISKSDFLAFPLTMSSGILGNCYLLFPRKDLAVITDLIIGGDGLSPMTEFDNLHISVLEEALSQIAGSLGSILSENLMRAIGVHLGKSEPTPEKLLINQNMICLDYDISLEGVSSLKMELLVPVDFCEEVAHQIIELKRPDHDSSNVRGGSGTGGTQSIYRKAVFPRFGDNGGGGNEPKIDIIMDIPLKLTVVLGKTKVSIKDLVELGPGSILELEKMAGEPVELYINDKLIGYGEVIVIEENFGVRVIEATGSLNPAAKAGGRI